MSPRQTTIPGTTARKQQNPKIADAALALDGAKEIRAQASRDLREKEAALFVVMRTLDQAKCDYFVPETGEIRTAYITEPKVRTKKTGDAHTEVGDGVDGGDEDDDSGSLVRTRKAPKDSVHPGLIAAALKAQDDANVEVTESGDVVVPDRAEPKAKRGHKPKAKRGK